MAKEQKELEATISIRVPADKQEYYKAAFYMIKYMDDPDDRIVVETIKNNPNLTAGKIAYKLIKEHGLKRDAARVRAVAKRTGLPIKH